VHGGHRLILVINGCKSERERASEGEKLLQYGFKQVDGG
jgi:D-alanyl-D-alanine carboxypeptidase